MLKMNSNKKTKLHAIKLIVEGGDGSLFGRVTYDDNLLIESAPSLKELEQKMRVLLFDFHDLEPETISFQFEYDLTAFFERFDFLKITKIAEVSGVNGSLMRQYATGKKFPSANQAEKIERAVLALAQQLSEVRIYSKL